METIPLEAIPNQRLAYTDGDNRYVILLQDIGDAMAYSIEINGVSILNGFEAVSNAPLIPYKYLENGNFVFVTEDNRIPYYTEFGVSQQLVYIPQSELDEQRS